MTRCMLFTDDIVLEYETRCGVDVKLQIWKDVLESIGFGPTTIKTEYMECKLSNRNKSEEVARLDG